MDLHAARFYGAKSEPIDSQTVSASVPLGSYEWQILDVQHGATTDFYQVLVADDEDALHTDAGAQAYLEGLAEFGEVHGDMSGSSARPLGADQSNTSLVVDERWILKVFRKLEDGLNPDVELLTGIADCPHVAGVRGHLVRDGRTLAMTQELIDGGRDGFQLATTNGLSDSDAHALGAAIRTVHDALASAFAVDNVPASQIRDSLNAHLDELVDQAEQLRAHEGTLREIYSRIPDGDLPVQRIHGDLHLGQTLYVPASEPDTGTGHWYLIDFEGEPARPLEQRRQPDHALRDVAGMVRSFGYAKLGNTDNLLAGYGTDMDALLAAYVADKAAYEVVYEANNRPDWVDIPLKAIRELG
ncbi:trehalose synthase [Corynebacterium sp. CCUG 65737]|uniref:phosphotransferase n=1 Tax=Corynebacterium sp. CCUG 65737 TaxID=2823889 RepID=UPI00210A075F|nr:phosphotransferase [Corynebacterium sp. CCUG 65737]MCQ4627768.1 trehalose synthase [Corynebacterium sp. CCUG 65737]